jgi:acylglycerol lipase
LTWKISVASGAVVMAAPFDMTDPLLLWLPSTAARMITMLAMLSTLSPLLSRRHCLALGGAALLSGCVSEGVQTGARTVQPELADDAFVMSDGARLPIRSWLPDGRPQTVILALHGFNDSRDAWEIPAPEFANAGIAVYAPDQRGFGAAPGRGYWPGTEALVNDAAEMAGLLQRRHPGVPMVLMGESMGGAVLMCLATQPDAPQVAGYVLVSPAVWGRARMNSFMRGGLWLITKLLPGISVSRPPPPVQVFASDNHAALVRLSRDPLTILDTRMDTLGGLVDLMDAALDAAPRFTARALFMYGAEDELVPKEATLAMWRSLPPGPHSLAYYPDGWHLMLRDIHRELPIGDVIAWTRDPEPGAPLPSGAVAAAQKWLAEQSA